MNTRPMDHAFHVLLVEDNPDDRLLMTRELRRAFPKLRTTAIGKLPELEEALLRPVDTVVTDYQLGWSDGLTIFRMVKAHHPYCPVIMFTGTGSQEVAVAAIRAGIDDYITKEPAHYIRLPIAVRTALEKVEQRRLMEQVQAERRRLEEELRHRVAELAARDRQKDEFLAMLAHELRNPLAPILNAAEVLRIRGDDPTVRERSTGTISRQVKHLAGLVDDLLEITRVTQGKIPLNKEAVRLDSLVDQAVEICRPVLDDRGIALTLSIPPDPVWLEVDPKRVVQAFCNLLSNAVKYTPREGQVEISVEVVEEKAVFRFRDTGIGMPRELIPHVFDLFVQGSRSLDRSEGGLGIGLTMVKRLVELHGGAVSAYSEGPGKGSEFVVELPLLKAAAPGAPDAAESHPLSPPSPSAGTGQRVLVIEDNADAARVLGELLELWGRDVRIAHDGPSGIQAAREYRPHVILLDVGLPGMDGYEVARQVRAEESLQGVTLVAMTGYGQEEDRRRAHEAAIDRHMTKPVEPETLQRLLDSMLEQR